VGTPPTVEALRARADASEACNAALREAQAELGAIAPPSQLERYHELLRAYVNEQRLVVELACQAARGERPIEDVLRVWERFASPGAVGRAVARRRRQRDAIARAAR